MTLRATYRLQFHNGFTFADAERRVDYLAALGISHVYSSPILAARAGSTHGYDVVDPSRINPELGGEPAFRSLVGSLRARGMGVLLDIVPNHMAVGGADNPYWLDVLEKGRASVFAGMFDIDWDLETETASDKVIVPMLGKPLASCISDGDISLVWDARLGKLAFAYGDNRFPLRAADYAAVVGDDDDPAGADLSRFADGRELAGLLARQYYRLVYWRDAGDRINWRRFFDITDLAAVRVEDDAVFETTHAAIFRLYGEGLIDGVRIDHVDGLADPAAYCRRLRARLEALMPQRPTDLAREPAIIVVEKILADGERLPSDWGVDGTTGYDFMNAVSGLQHDPAGEATLTELWTAVSRRSADFEDEERVARAEMLDHAFANALRSAAAAFCRVHDGAEPPDLAYERALHSLIEHFRAYRTYALGDRADPPPGAIFDSAAAAARDTLSTDVDAANALALIARVMHGESAEHGDAARDAARRFNQLAAPVAAKAVEDTAFYRYGRLLSRNDVGFGPRIFASPPSVLHEQNAMRASSFPSALLATATHDHKRGEDARARLAALSELSERWSGEAREWFALNAGVRPKAISPADEYQLYQALVGACPLELDASGPAALERFTQRILGWREKSLREAKLETSWSEPNTRVETAHRDFVNRLLDPSHAFVARLSRFVDWIAPAGALNGLVACALRCTSPGVPDLYQGAELWDFSLVDPDNRRAVDFDLRADALREVGDPAETLGDWKNGRVKLAVLRRLLALRQEMPELFSRGAYRPVAADDAAVFCFARTLASRTLVVAVPRLCAADATARGLPLPRADVGRRAAMSVLKEWPGREWRNALLSEPRNTCLDETTNVFERLPAALLFSE